jgi:hypothetical protein
MAKAFARLAASTGSTDPFSYAPAGSALEHARQPERKAAVDALLNGAERRGQISRRRRCARS